MPSPWEIVLSQGHKPTSPCNLPAITDLTPLHHDLDADPSSPPTPYKGDASASGEGPQNTELKNRAQDLQEEEARRDARRNAAKISGRNEKPHH